MKCVILAAGEGRRMRPLTEHAPKPLLKVAGRPIIEHVISALPEEITELVVVTGYLGDKIRQFLGKKFLGRDIAYVHQDQRLGTAHALKLCQPHLGGERFLFTNADDLYDPAGIKECLRHERSLLVAEHDEPERFGVVSINSDGTVADIIEKPEQPKTRLVSTGLMALDENIFSYRPDRHKNGEYYLTTMVEKMLTDYPVHAVKTSWWFPIASPEHLSLAEEFLKQRRNL